MSDRGGLGLEVDEAGLCLRALGLWLDPTRPVAAAFVSHAHAARASKGSGLVFASPETLALAGAIDEGADDARALGWRDAVELPIAPSFGGGSARLSIAPAGHMLGAAQLVIDHPRGRMVYTGDFGAGDDATHAAGVAVECDELVVTSTFALPIFRFDAHAQTLASIVDWCAAQIAEDRSPIVLARSPGPAQSVVHALAARGLAVAAHDDVARAVAAYEALGVSLGFDHAAAGAADVPSGPPPGAETAATRGAVLVAPPGAKKTAASAFGRSRRSEVRIAYASGWAVLDAATEQKRADAAFPLADQADHDALMALVHATGARVVHATRGDARAFAHLLRRSGMDADALELPPIDERGVS